MSLVVAPPCTKPFTALRTPVKEATLSWFTSVFWKVEEAVVLVAVKYEETVCPTTASAAYGEVVPIPTKPLWYVFPTTSSLASEEVESAPMTTWLVVVETAIPLPLIYVQLISEEPPDPASTPQRNCPLPSL